MSYTEILNRPYFVVPPDSPQAQLLLDRAKRVGAPGWYCETGDGTVYFSIAIYFGVFVMHPEQPSEREAYVRRALGFPAHNLLRLDYACSKDALYLLRAGEPGQRPVAFSTFDAPALHAAESFLADVLDTDFRTILLSRSIQDADTSMLFAGETILYEGFLGEGGLPLRMRCATHDAPPAPQGALVAALA